MTHVSLEQMYLLEVNEPSQLRQLQGLVGNVTSKQQIISWIYFPSEAHEDSRIET
jgi:hypothetical protein